MTAPVAPPPAPASPPAPAPGSAPPASLRVQSTLTEPHAARQSPHAWGAPCTMIILGASGDLSRRKLIPALYHLSGDGLLPAEFRVIGAAREAMTDDAFREAMRAAVGEHGEGATDPAKWAPFAARLSYVSGDLDDPATYATLKERLSAIEQEVAGGNGEGRGRLFHLALPPSVYQRVLVHLSESGLAPRRDDAASRPWVRVIVEKPFGRDLASARALNAAVRAHFAEHQLFRIDHYLGKDTVQNLLVFRFGNSIFEPVWSRDHIARVEITAAEEVGVEHRAGYYEEAGVVRDMFQNHLLQLLALTAMEPPATFRAEAVRNEKVKVLEAVRPIARDDVARVAVRGQYGPGTVGGTAVPGYREEPGVAPDSVTPTFAALRLHVDNWRWQGVPFILRSGKRLARRDTEVVIHFRRPPHLMLPQGDGQRIEGNCLTFQIQPEEGLSLCFQVKVPGVEMRVTSASMDFSYAAGFGAEQHSAYETLLLDAMAGDATLFTRSDAVEASWRVVDPVIAAWEASPPDDFPNYPAGTWGPAAAARLSGGEPQLP
ncbi:MAG: glucose-6-phosphate dehydrogenase [Gemmatimonadaceae bacterium]